MSQNWICSKCKAYNHPKRQICWQCGYTLVKDTPHKRHYLSIRSLQGKFIIAVAIIVFLSCIALAVSRWILPANIPTYYKLSWKIVEGQPIAYNTAMQVSNSNISVDFDRIFNSDQSDQSTEQSSIFEEILGNIGTIQPTYSIVSILEKNPRDNISVKMILGNVDTSELKSDDWVGQWSSLFLKGMEGSILLQGEITSEGKIASPIAQQQKNLLALFFELPTEPVKVGDAWPIDLTCIAVNSAQFTIENSDRINQVTLAKIAETPAGKPVAILDYLIIESVKGKQAIPFFTKESVPTSMKCSFIGQGQFLIEQGRWEQFSAEYTVQTTGIMTSTITQYLALSPLDKVPEYSRTPTALPSFTSTPAPTLTHTPFLESPTLNNPPIPRPTTAIRMENLGQVTQLAQLGKSMIQNVAWSPDGTLLAVGTLTGIWLYDAQTLAQVRYIEAVAGYVTFSPDGTLLASTANNSITLWEVASGQTVLTIEPSEWASRVTFSPNGTLLASVAPDKVNLWDVASGRLVHTLVGHSTLVSSATFSPDNTIVASGSWDNTIKLWDAASGRELATLTGHTNWISSVTFSPDGTMLASGAADGTVKLWDVASRQEIRSLAGQIGLSEVAFSPDGTLLASMSGFGVKLWETASGHEVRTITITEPNDTVSSFAFSPDGTSLALTTFTAVSVWSLATGHETGSITDYVDAGENVTFSPDGTLLASVSDKGTVRLWEVSSGREVRTLVGDTYWVDTLDFSSDGKLLAVGSGGGDIKLWDVASGREAHTLKLAFLENVSEVAFSPDNTLLAAGFTGSDGMVEVWEVASWRKVTALTGYGSVTSIAFSPDGALVASGVEDGTIKLWEAGSWREVRTLAGHTSAVLSVAFSPDGMLLASGSGSEDNTIKIWEVATGRELHTLTGHMNNVEGVAFSPDGTLLASVAGDKTIKLWDVANGRELVALTGHTHWVESVCFSPDGTLLVSGSADGTVRLWGVAP